MLKDSTVVANFKRDSFNVALTVNPIGAGTATTPGKYECGKEAEFIATPEECYKFVK
jgi:hypothetical protein